MYNLQKIAHPFFQRRKGCVALLGRMECAALVLLASRVASGHRYNLLVSARQRRRGDAECRQPAEDVGIGQGGIVEQPRLHDQAGQIESAWSRQTQCLPRAAILFEGDSRDLEMDHIAEGDLLSGHLLYSLAFEGVAIYSALLPPQSSRCFPQLPTP